MQIQCPKCKEWIEPSEGICPLCSANINQAQTAVDLPKSFYVKKNIKRLILLVLAILLVMGVIAFARYMTDTDDLYPIHVKESYYKTMEGCLPSNDVVEVPVDADEETVLNIEKEIYEAHLKHTDCVTPGGDPNSSWASRIGSGWLSKKNYKIMAKNPKYLQVLDGNNGSDFIGDDEGCYGFPLSVAYDGMLLYIRSPKSGSIELAFTANQTHLQSDDHLHGTVMERLTDELTSTPYTVHKPDRTVAPVERSVIVSEFEEVPYSSGWTVEPVNRSPILYGIDQDHYTEGMLKQVKGTSFYSFYSGEALFLNMKNASYFRVVFQVKRKNQSFIIYRVYPLWHAIPTDAQFFDSACKF